MRNACGERLPIPVFVPTLSLLKEKVTEERGGVRFLLPHNLRQPIHHLGQHPEGSLDRLRRGHVNAGEF